MLAYYIPQLEHRLAAILTATIKVNKYFFDTRTAKPCGIRQLSFFVWFSIVLVFLLFYL